MAKRKIVWSSTAKEEFREVLAFYRSKYKSSDFSIKLKLEVFNLLETLSKSPVIGRTTATKGIRVIPKRHYLIFYEVRADQIEVVSFWDNRRNPDGRSFN